MYRIAKDTKVIDQARNVSKKYLKEIVRILKEKDGIVCQAELVGSARRKMITYNGKDHTFDFDYNLIISNGLEYDEKKLKNKVRKAFNQVMRENHLKDVEDSRSSLTSKPITISYTYFHIDLAIVTMDHDHLLRLIHNKMNNTYYWNQSGSYGDFKHKEKLLIKGKHLQEITDTYIDKKNLHIDEEDTHPSYISYIEAVNEVYEKYKEKL